MEEYKGKPIKYFEELDKRTSEYKKYKEWKESHDQESKGLGDSIEKLTKATGIDKAVKFIAGEDCGCDERKEILNKLFTYDNPKCLEEDEYNYLTSFFKNPPELVSVDIQKKMLAIHNRIFKNQEKPSSCSACLRRVFKKMQKVLESY